MYSHFDKKVYVLEPELKELNLIDQSWINDACPSFIIKESSGHILWIEAKLKNDRAAGCTGRYTILGYAHKDLFTTDSSAELIEYIKENYYE